MRNEIVRYRTDGQTAVITLDSPQNRNALSAQLAAELSAQLKRAEADDDVNVALISHTGRAFCSGLDLTEARGGMEDSARRLVELQRLIVTLEKPVVTRIGGPVRAGGLAIVAASDVAISADDATFALTEVKLGLAAAIVSLTVFARMNPRAASLTTLGGEVFTGRQAEAFGLVTRAVPADRLDDEVGAVCADLASGSRQGLRESKAILNAELVRRIDDLGERRSTFSARLFHSDVAQAAIQSFLSRRPV